MTTQQQRDTRILATDLADIGDWLDERGMRSTTPVGEADLRGHSGTSVQRAELAPVMMTSAAGATDATTAVVAGGLEPPPDLWPAGDVWRKQLQQRAVAAADGGVAKGALAQVRTPRDHKPSDLSSPAPTPLELGRGRQLEEKARSLFAEVPRVGAVARSRSGRFNNDVDENTRDAAMPSLASSAMTAAGVSLLKPLRAQSITGGEDLVAAALDPDVPAFDLAYDVNNAAEPRTPSLLFLDFSGDTHVLGALPLAGPIGALMRRVEEEAETNIEQLYIQLGEIAADAAAAAVAAETTTRAASAATAADGEGTMESSVPPAAAPAVGPEASAGDVDGLARALSPAAESSLSDDSANLSLPRAEPLPSPPLLQDQQQQQQPLPPHLTLPPTAIGTAPIVDDESVGPRPDKPRPKHHRAIRVPLEKYGVEERQAKIARYMKRRVKLKLARRAVQYADRRAFAQQRPRVQGRFVPKNYVP